MSLDMLVDSSQLNTDLTSIADAIREKTGGAELLEFPDEFVSEIGSITTGGLELKDVNFIDYDGTLLYSYTAEEAAALTALPDNPTHEGLIAQGWNYTLAEMQAEITAQGQCDIGQLYITDDGKTRLYCHFEEGRHSPYLCFAPKGTVTIDWGDGTTSSVTGSSETTLKNTLHNYANAGDYVITLTPENNATFAFYMAGTGTGITAVLRKSTYTQADQHQAYYNALRKVELGVGAIIATHAFGSCRMLESITTTRDTYTLGATYAFNDCTHLRGFVFPPVSRFAERMFSECYSLRAVSLMTVVENQSIATRMFANCGALSRICIPSTIVNMSEYAFQNTNLKSVVIPEVGYTGNNGSHFSSCKVLKKVTVLSDAIAKYMFSGCFLLEDIDMPNVKTIGNYGISTCVSLLNIDLPEGVTELGNNVFNECSGIVNITLPSTIETIGTNFCYYCKALKSVHIKATTPPTVGSSLFSGVTDDLMIYVPEESLSDYQTATNWSAYASKMVGE